MPKRFKLADGAASAIRSTAMLNKTALCLLGFVCAVVSGGAQTVAPSQIEQAREFNQQASSVSPSNGAAPARSTAPEISGNPDDAFGAQILLKRNEPPKTFSGFAEIADYYTSNVALSHRDARSDSFMVATFGAAAQRSLLPDLQVAIIGRLSLFRYGKYGAFDFDSLDLGAGLTWTPQRLGGISLFARYGLADLISAHSGDSFFTEQSATAGAQRTFSLGRAQAITVGASALFGFAEPKEAQRDEYSIYAGYHLPAARQVQVDLFYRSAYYDYRRAVGRADFNNSVALAVEYDPAAWMAITASTFFGHDASNQSDFSYNVLNAGGGLTLTAKF